MHDRLKRRLPGIYGAVRSELRRPPIEWRAPRAYAPVTMARIVDAQKFRETVGAQLESARARIETRLDSALRQTYGKRTFDAAQ